MSAVSTILMNWSPVAVFRKMPVPTVEATRLTRVRTQRIMTLVMLSSMPLATIAAPKHIAQIISQMVFSIPAIPPVETRSFKASNPV